MSSSPTMVLRGHSEIHLLGTIILPHRELQRVTHHRFHQEQELHPIPPKNWKMEVIPKTPQIKKTAATINNDDDDDDDDDDDLNDANFQ